jgi:SET domain-containing protein
MARKMSRQAARSRIRRKDSDKIRPGVRKKRREIPQLAPGASPFRLRVARSPIQGFGVFALESIPKHHKVIEYTGKRMTVRAYDQEQRNARSMRRTRVCFFYYTKRWGVDGAVGGSGAELINHGCDPNIKTRKMRGHILYFSKRRIRAGEELLVDYHIDPRCVRYPCNCGSPKCRGTMNYAVASPEKRVATSERKSDDQNRRARATRRRAQR